MLVQFSNHVQILRIARFFQSISSLLRSMLSVKAIETTKHARPEIILLRAMRYLRIKTGTSFHLNPHAPSTIPHKNCQNGLTELQRSQKKTLALVER